MGAGDGTRARPAVGRHRRRGRLFRPSRGLRLESLRAARAYNKTVEHYRRGGSTISQQAAKNLFLWEEGSYLRKAVETYFTLLIEAAWPKRRILEVYLNIAQFGPITFGAEAASRRFFDKPAAALTRSEAALLVAVLPNPRERRADRPERTVRYRQLLILGSMSKLGPQYLARSSIPRGPLDEPAAVATHAHLAGATLGVDGAQRPVGSLVRRGAPGRVRRAERWPFGPRHPHDGRQVTIFVGGRDHTLHPATYGRYRGHRFDGRLRPTAAEVASLLDRQGLDPTRGCCSRRSRVSKAGSTPCRPTTAPDSRGASSSSRRRVGCLR